jgi:selenide,water dikinase
VLVPGRPPVAYDVASIDIGITSDLPALPGFAAHAVGAKPLGPYAAAWARFVAEAAAGRQRAQVAVIGAGVGGVELALASAHRLRAAGAADPAVTLIERAATPLPGVGAGARRALLAHLNRLGVTVVTGAEVARVDAGAVHLADGRRIAARFVVGAAGARPQAWLAETGLALHDGFVCVGPTLQTTTDPALFAVGDCAHMAHAPRPKAGVFAVRQAPVLRHNLIAALAGGAMRRYRPQRDYLKLVSTGGKGAVADRAGLRLDGGWLWWWKDRIDRRFMARFDDLPAMPRAVVPARAARGLRAEVEGRPPLCGGCGAKMAGGALAGVLDALAPPQRADVLAGPGDDAAVLRHGAGVQVITTDHLRPLVADPVAMTRLTALHALGDVWAMGAAAQVALAQVVLPPLSQRLQARTLDEITRTAAAVFRAAGADLAGGHTSLGAEMSIGFTVTGLAAQPLSKGGGQPGDVLILTRALGSGVIFAAEMALARLPGALMTGEAVAAALAAMQHPGGPAAAILADAARALTDVTGFGLAGHLLEMAAAAGCGARLSLAAIPLLPGAEALAAAGHGSSLLAGNLAAVAGRLEAPPGPRTDLLCDPQTAGGFLAAVPAERAERVLAALHAAGEGAAVAIGDLVAGPVRITAA